MIRRVIGSLDAVTVRFILNGLLATAVHFAVLWSLLHFQVLRAAGPASGVASMVGITVSYAGSRYFVFRSEKRVIHTLPSFIAIYALVGGLHWATLSIWTDWLGLPYPIGFIGATGLATVCSYLANRYLVFAEKKSES